MEWRGYLDDLRRDQSDDATPAEADAEKVEQTHVETICASLDLCQDLAIVLGDAWWQSLLALLDLARRPPVESRRWNLLKVWVLECSLLVFHDQQKIVIAP